MHQSPMQKVLGDERFGVRPGSRTKVHELIDEEMKEWEEEEAMEEAAEREANAEINGNGNGRHPQIIF